MSESIDKYIIPRFLLNEIYPYSEGIQLEFKKSFHINQHYKYRETICAFLNTQGGIIIYGIDDNCQILGCYLTDKEKDDVLLFVDNLHNILKTTAGNNINSESIKVDFEKIAKNLYIVMIKCYKFDDIKSQFINGDSWIRMNASNMKVIQDKLYLKEHINNIKKKLYNKYQTDITHTAIIVSNIMISKQKKEEQINNMKNYYLLKYNRNAFAFLLGVFITFVLISIIRYYNTYIFFAFTS